VRTILLEACVFVVSKHCGGIGETADKRQSLRLTSAAPLSRLHGSGHTVEVKETGIVKGDDKDDREESWRSNKISGISRKTSRDP